MLSQDQIRANFEEALTHMDEFARGEAPPQQAARKIAKCLDEMGIAYVVAGGLAVAANGLQRFTEDVDLIMTPEGLAAFKVRWLGAGWVERFKGSKGLKDVSLKLKIDVLTTNERPGDGKSCPFTFPDPATVGHPVGGIWGGMRMLDLRTLIELKLASWMTSPHRLRDGDDVVRLIKLNTVPKDFGASLHPYVRDKFTEEWHLAQVQDPYDEP
jgi:hypothetical protein